MSPGNAGASAKTVAINMAFNASGSGAAALAGMAQQANALSSGLGKAASAQATLNAHLATMAAAARQSMLQGEMAARKVEEDARRSRVEADRKRRDDQYNASATSRAMAARSAVSGDLMGAAGALAPGPVGLVAAALTGLEKSFRAGAEAMKALTSTTLTVTEKQNRLIESVPVVGSLFHSWRKLVEEGRGTSAKIQQTGIETGRFHATEQTRHAYQMRLDSATSRHDTARYSAGELWGLGPVQPAVLTGTSLAEQHRFEEASRLEGPVQAGRLAGARRDAAARDVAAEEARKAELEKVKAGHDRTANAAWRRYQATLAQENAGRGGEPRSTRGIANPTDRAVAGFLVGGAVDRADRRVRMVNDLAAAEKAATLAKQAQAQIDATSVRLQEKRVGLAQAESAVRQSNIQKAQAELSYATQRYQVAAGHAQSLGGMSQGDYNLNLASARLVAKHGLAGVTPEVQARAAAYDPEAVGALRREYGNTRREANRGKFEGPHAGAFNESQRDSLEDARKRMNEANRHALELPQIDAQKLSADMAEALRGLVGDIKAAMLNAVADVRREFNIGWQQRNRAEGR